MRSHCAHYAIRFLQRGACLRKIRTDDGCGAGPSLIAVHQNTGAPAVLQGVANKGQALVQELRVERGGAAVHVFECHPLANKPQVGAGGERHAPAEGQHVGDFCRTQAGLVVCSPGTTYAQAAWNNKSWLAVAAGQLCVDQSQAHHFLSRKWWLSIGSWCWPKRRQEFLH